MASKDLTVLLYDNTIKVEYKDKAHRYYVSECDPVGVKKDGGDEVIYNWNKARLVKGVTTIMDGVLEKNGLLTWPLNMAMRELFGYYDFKNEKGERMQGFSKGVGTVWGLSELTHKTDGTFDKDAWLPFIDSANKAWTRRKKMGADIGSLVHEAIENHVLGREFHITVEQYKLGQEFEDAETEAAWDKKAADEVAMAALAFGKFVEWWTLKKPDLLGSEELIYSKSLDYCGAYDGFIRLDGKLMRADWKTSNASTNPLAAMPKGISYSYFIQLGGYELAAREMGLEPSDDLIGVSCRKDGEFDTVLASEVGLSVEDCIKAWEATHGLFRMITATKKQLMEV